jgi:phospholipid/cholesterol/gamma-HCH transport system substrate-binding protein
MQTTPKKRAVIVGSFIFLGLLFLLGGILTIGNLHSTFSRKVEITAIFDDVNGLQAGNNVWFSGVKIGTVKKLSFYGDSKVLVEMKLDEKLQPYIRKDAKAKISTDGLIGNKLIIIYGGTQSAAAVEDGDALGIEDQVSTEEMMDVLQENNRNLLQITTDFKAVSSKIASGQGSLGKLIQDESLYRSMDATMNSLQRSSVNAEKLTAAVADYGQKLNKEGTLANDLVTDTTVFSSVQASVRQLEKTMVIATAAADYLKTTTSNMSKATDKLGDKNTPVGVLLNDEQAAANLKGTLKNLESGSEKLDQDLRALQDNFLLRRYFKKKKKAEARGDTLPN